MNGEDQLHAHQSGPGTLSDQMHVPTALPAEGQAVALPVADCGHVPTLDPDGRTASCHPCGRMWPLSYLVAPEQVTVSHEAIRHVLDSYGVEEFDGSYGVVGVDNLVADLTAIGITATDSPATSEGPD